MSTTRTSTTTMRRRSFLGLGVGFAAPCVNSVEAQISVPHDNAIEIAQMIAERSFFTSECNGNVPGQELSFHPVDGRKMMADPRCHLILHHDYAVHADGWLTVPVTRQAFPLFTSGRQRVDRLSVTQVERILAGRTTDWKDVGGNDGRIRLILKVPNERNYRPIVFRRMEYLFRRGGINVAVEAIPCEKVEDYRTLAAIVRRDANVLGIGLRGVPLDGLKAIAVNGSLPGEPGSYPFVTNISATARTGNLGEKLLREYIEFGRPRFAMDEKLIRSSGIEGRA